MCRAASNCAAKRRIKSAPCEPSHGSQSKPLDCGRHQNGAPLRPWRYERAARQRGACFEASYQRQNGLTKQHTKQTAADDLRAENEDWELSSLHTKYVVN
eukprot:6212101-Pleurochrysis_carterae.AAC.2